MGEILAASSYGDLRLKLAQIDILVPRRSEGRTTHHTERYGIAHLLATLAQTRLSFPLVLTHGDRPDFVLEMPGTTVGIEHSEAVPENVARAQIIRERELGEISYFTPHATPDEPRKTAEQLRQEIKANHPSSGWIGDSAEREWAAAIAHRVQDKLRKAKLEGFATHPFNWLLIYDNWPLPHISLAKATGILFPLLKEMGAFSTFEAIFVHDDSTMCELRDSPVLYSLGDPKHGG